MAKSFSLIVYSSITPSYNLYIYEKKEFIKLHISVDEESKKIVSFRITKGNVHDTKKFGRLVKESAKKYDIYKVYGDKAYDNRKNFNILDDINAEPAISIRKNTYLPDPRAVH